MVRLNVSVRNVLQQGLTGSGDYLKCHLSVYTLINVIFKIEIFNEKNNKNQFYDLNLRK